MIMKGFVHLVQLLICINLLLVLLDAESLSDNEVQVPESDEQDIFENGKTGSKKIKLTVFYATQCPWCIKFFKEQLPKLFDSKVGKGLYKYVNFDLVPFVEAAYKDSHDNWTYKCMHGAEECEYSKLHSCILKELSVTKSPDYRKKLIQFIVCLMNTRTETDVKQQCVKQYQIKTKNIDACLNDTDSVGNLMYSYVERAENNKPSVNFVPWIQFNNKFNESDSSTAQGDIIKGICDHLQSKPKVCKTAAERMGKDLKNNHLGKSVVQAIKKRNHENEKEVFNVFDFI